MAYVILGRANCGEFAKAERLAEKLAKQFPAFCFSVRVAHPNEWDAMLESAIASMGFGARNHRVSPLVWLDVGRYIGDYAAFAEEIWKHYRLSVEDEPAMRFAAIADENMAVAAARDKRSKEAEFATFMAQFNDCQLAASYPYVLGNRAMRDVATSIAVVDPYTGAEATRVLTVPLEIGLLAVQKARSVLYNTQKWPPSKRMTALTQVAESLRVWAKSLAFAWTTETGCPFTESLGIVSAAIAELEAVAVAFRELQTADAAKVETMRAAHNAAIREHYRELHMPPPPPPAVQTQEAEEGSDSTGPRGMAAGATSGGAHDSTSAASVSVSGSMLSGASSRGLSGYASTPLPPAATPAPEESARPQTPDPFVLPYERRSRGAASILLPAHASLRVVVAAVAPCIAAGAPFVLLPHPATPLTAMLFVQILCAVAGPLLPRGSFSAVVIESEAARRDVAADARVGCVLAMGPQSVLANLSTHIESNFALEAQRLSAKAVAAAVDQDERAAKAARRAAAKAARAPPPVPVPTYGKGASTASRAGGSLRTASGPGAGMGSASASFVDSRASSRASSDSGDDFSDAGLGAAEPMSELQMTRRVRELAHIGQLARARARPPVLVPALSTATVAVVFEDAELRPTVQALLAGILGAERQRACPLRRVFIAQAVYDRVAAAFVEGLSLWQPGHPLRAQTAVGRLESEAAARAADALAEKLTAQRGARLVVGGLREGLVFPATVVQGHGSTAELDTAVAGPIAVFVPFSDEELLLTAVAAAVEGAQCHLAVFSRSAERMARMRELFDTEGVVAELRPESDVLRAAATAPSPVDSDAGSDGDAGAAEGEEDEAAGAAGEGAAAAAAPAAAAPAPAAAAAADAAPADAADAAAEEAATAEDEAAKAKAEAERQRRFVVTEARVPVARVVAAQLPRLLFGAQTPSAPASIDAVPSPALVASHAALLHELSVLAPTAAETPLPSLADIRTLLWAQEDALDSEAAEAAAAGVLEPAAPVSILKGQAAMVAAAPGPRVKHPVKFNPNVEVREML